MDNPYAPTLDLVVDNNKKLQGVIDLWRFAWLLLVWLVVTYAVSLPASRMVTKDISLIVMSPLMPIGVLAHALIGESVWTWLLTLFACPITVSLVVGALGVRKRRAWLAAISMGVLYGLFLRLFYMVCDIV